MYRQLTREAEVYALKYLTDSLYLAVNVSTSWLIVRAGLCQVLQERRPRVAAEGARPPMLYHWIGRLLAFAMKEALSRNGLMTGDSLYL
jgi:hypothetical protein